MKYLLLIFALLNTTNLLCYYAAKVDRRCETIEQAKARFEKMTVGQIQKLDPRTFTPEQTQAFQQLASSIFRTEIASADCFSQANKRKYEVMYQKLGTICDIRKV